MEPEQWLQQGRRRKQSRQTTSSTNRPPFVKPKMTSAAKPYVPAFKQPTPPSTVKSTVWWQPPKSNKPEPKPATLPLIWKTDIPQKLHAALTDENGPKAIVIQAPTGYGKTILTISELAKINKANPSITCAALMPFRVSVKEMYKHLPKLFPDLDFGYTMRGDVQVSPTNNCRLSTVGYWLEQFVGSLKGGQDDAELRKKPMIVLVDEVHDSSWQTDLALRILLWAQRKGYPIKIILSSATLNVVSILNSLPYDSKLILDVTQDKANVDIHFLENYVASINKGKMTEALLKAALEQLTAILEETKTGDGLVIMPGQEEIEDFIDMLERQPAVFGDLVVHSLYSQLSREDIEAAIEPDQEGRRKLIVATNIVENAITIKGLAFMIDSGLRKVNKVDDDGVSQLCLEPAARSNLGQSTGRVGREGEKGHAYVLMTKYDFEMLKPYASNEVHNNPLYLQIIKLCKDQLPVEEILNHIDSYRIRKDCNFLVAHGALKRTRTSSSSQSDEDDSQFSHSTELRVTDLGEIMAHLHLSIRAGHFLSHVVRNLPNKELLKAPRPAKPSKTTTRQWWDPPSSSEDSESTSEEQEEEEEPLMGYVWYTACVLSAWMDSTTSLFYHSNKKPGQSQDAYAGQVVNEAEHQEEFYEADCAMTMLNVWFSSWTCIPRTSNNSFYRWCKENCLFDRSLKDLSHAVDHTIASLGKLGFNVFVPSVDECQAHLDHLETIMSRLVPVIEIAYRDWTFRRDLSTVNCYIPLSGYSRLKYFIDRSVANETIRHSGHMGQKIVALGVRQINAGTRSLSKIVKI